MKRAILFFLVGAIFGLGLVVSQMTNPNKVQGFLDVFGAWDASLMFVIVGAILVTAIGYRLVLRREKPFIHKEFILPSRKDIDFSLVVGSAIFGVGWGVSGFCPAPALASLVIGVWDPLIMCTGIVIGSLGYWLVFER